MKHRRYPSHAPVQSGGGHIIRCVPKHPIEAPGQMTAASALPSRCVHKQRAISWQMGDAVRQPATRPKIECDRVTADRRIVADWFRAEIEKAGGGLAFEFANERQDWLRRIKEPTLSSQQRWLSPSPMQKSPGEEQRRVRIVSLCRHRGRTMVLRYWQPRPYERKSCTGRSVPRHWRAAPVATLIFGPERDAVGIAQIPECQFRLRQAQLLALIDERRSG